MKMKRPGGIADVCQPFAIRRPDRPFMKRKSPRQLGSSAAAGRNRIEIAEKIEGNGLSIRRDIHIHESPFVGCKGDGSCGFYGEFLRPAGQDNKNKQATE